MTDATPTSDASTPNHSTTQRRRLLAAGAVVGVAIALGGGVAAGVAAVVSRTAAPAPSDGGASIYFPIAGSPQQSNGAQPQYGASGGAAAPAIAQAPGAAARSFATNDLAMSAPSIAYPYPGGWCNAGPAPTTAGPGITATGLAQITLPTTPSTAQTLNVGVQTSNSNDNVKAALADVQQKLAAIRDALHKAGVPDADITQQGINVYGNGNPKVTNVNVNGSLSATISDTAVLDKALTAAADAGATSVNVWSGNGNSAATPDDKTLQSAITKATAAAKSMAQTQAQAAGVSLGALQSSQVQPPSICGWTAGGAQMVVGVTLTYAVK